jgi:hypothetical protein
MTTLFGSSVKTAAVSYGSSTNASETITKHGDVAKRAAKPTGEGSTFQELVWIKC